MAGPNIHQREGGRHVNVTKGILGFCFVLYFTSIHGSGCVHLFPGGAELRMCEIGGITDPFESDTAGTAGGLGCM